MFKWDHMTMLFISFGNICLSFSFFMVNCKCEIKNGYDYSSNTKISNCNFYKYVVQSVGTSFRSSSDLTRNLGVLSHNLNDIKLLDEFDQDVTTEINTSPCSKPGPGPGPEPEPEPQPCTTEPAPPQFCPEETQNVSSHTIVWPLTSKNQEAESKPLCLDEQMKILRRKCEDTWEDVHCESIQEDIYSPCPRSLKFHYIKDKNYCYKIIEKTTFPPKCPYPETLGWDEYVNLNLTKDPIWMPVVKENNTDYGIDLMRFTERTQNYKVPFEICTQSCLNYFYSGSFLDKNCQIYHNSTHIEIVSCDEEYSAVCMYKALPFRTKSFCSQVKDNCIQSGYEVDSKCFCEATSNNEVEPYDLAELLLPYQNLLYTKLGKSCLIGLENIKNELPAVSFIWSVSNTTINYTNWAKNKNINFENKYGYITSDGWILQADNDEDCILYQTAAPTDTGTLRLNFDESFRLEIRNYKSFLSDENGNPLVYCFTDADAYSLIFRIQNFSTTTTDIDDDNFIYNFDPLTIAQSGPGNYWCEAFLYPELRIVPSNILRINKHDSEFVAILKLKHYEEKLSHYPLTEENLATLQNLLKNELQNSLSFFPRIFKVNEIDEINKELTVTFHLTSAVANNNTEELFKTLRDAVKAQTMFEFIEFRSVDYCFVTQTTQSDDQIVTWPTIYHGETTHPQHGFCVSENMTLIERTCLENFIDGTYWSELTENCTFYYPSIPITENILNIKNCTDSCDDSLNVLLEITGNYSYFNPLELVLTVNFLMKIVEQKPNLEKIAGITNNLMKISRPVLFSSQLNFKATDLLIHFIDKVLEDGEFEEQRTENFAIKSINIKDNNGTYGIMLQNCSTSYNDCDLISITDTDFLNNESFILTNKVVAAIVISETLYKQINNYVEKNSTYVPKLILSIYYGSQLFVEVNTPKSSNYVFGILFPGFIKEEFEGPLSIYYFNATRNNLPENNCSYWNFDNASIYSSWTPETTENNNQTVYCEFFHVTNFGITSNLVEKYCDTSKNNGENSVCKTEEFSSDTKYSVKYQQLCEPQEKINLGYTNLNELNSETVPCTIFLTEESNKYLSNYCITDNGTAVPTKCLQNFEKNSYIFSILENCVTHSFSHLSKSIFNITNTLKEDCWNLIFDILLQYTEYYVKFTNFDLLVVATVVKPIAYFDPDLEKVAGIVNNIMKIPSPILSSAQSSFQAIDILLHNIEEVLKWGDCHEWKTENFALKCLDINTNSHGITVSNCSKDFSNCKFSSVTFTNTIYNEAYFRSRNIQAMIILTPKLYNQIMAYGNQNKTYNPKMIISLYSGSQLFIELDEFSSEKNVFSFVFGILLPDFNDYFTNPILIYYLNNLTNQHLQFNCSYWKYDDNNYGSWITESENVNDLFAKCEFFHVTNFAIQSKYGNHELENPKRFQSVNRNSSVISRFVVKKENMCVIKDERPDVYKNQYVLQYLMVNIFSKINPFWDHYFSQLTMEYFLSFFGFVISAWSNKLNENTELLNKESPLNTNFHIIRDIRNLSSMCLNCEANENICEESKSKSQELEINIKELYSKSVNNLDALTELKHLLLKHNFNDFNENIIHLIAQILQETRSVANPNTLKELSNILNILMIIPKDIMFKAQAKFQSADKILYFIDNILREFETTIQIHKENLTFLVISKEDALHFVGFYVTTDKDVVLVKKRNEAENNEADIDFRVIISMSLHEQIVVRRTRIMFVIFYSDIYFPDRKKHYVKKPIVEVLFPDLKETLEADFTITYKFTDNLNQFSECSYWDHVVTEHKVIKLGSWKNEFPAKSINNWVTCSFKHTTHFALVISSRNITTDLEYILNSNLTGLDKLKQVDTITLKSYGNLIPVDIFLISQIIGSSLTEGTIVRVVSSIISNLFNVPREVLKESQKAHTATDIILHNIDEMATMINETSQNFDNFSLIVKDIGNINLTGLILHNCKEYKCSIDQLENYINISDYTDNSSMSAMLIFSEELVTQIKNSSVNSKVIISIYYSNALFNEIGNERETTMIFGVVFPGINTLLNGMVSVVYNNGTKINNNNNNQCAYWYYKADPDGNVDNATYGKWKNDTTKEWQRHFAICNFSHVTHFAMLLFNNDDYNNDAVLKVITDIGCILSLMGIIIILLTAFVFKKWRQNTGNKILIHFSIAISLKIGMLYISEYVKSSSAGIGCTISGIILHYAILSECAWMLTIAILQFKRFVEVLGGPPKYVLVKALICGWVFPTIPIICVISIDPDNYMKGNAGLCYPSHLGLYLGVWLPVAIIITINCVIFIFIIYNVFHKKTDYIDSANYEILFQWRLALLLFFMLGLTWLFGFFGEIKGDSLFTYLFCITASMQGFVLFLFFIVFNKSTRILYSHYAKQWFYTRGIFKLGQTDSHIKN